MKIPIFSILAFLGMVILISCQDEPKNITDNQNLESKIKLTITSIRYAEELDITVAVNVTNTEKENIIERGIVWDVNTLVTINNNRIISESSDNPYRVTITNSEYNIVLNIKAYAITLSDTIFSDVKITETKSFTPVTSFIGISDITEKDLKCSFVTEYNEHFPEVFEQGICWSTNEIPTLNDFNKNMDNIYDTCVTSIINLESATNYYFRAYAINKYDTGYSEIHSTFTHTIDVDGNTYPVNKYGNKIWMTSNLQTLSYKDGSLIGINDANDPYDIKKTWPVKGNENNTANYGRYYSWYAAMDERGICPCDFRMPTIEDWMELVKNIEDKYGYSSTIKALASNYGWKSVSASNLSSDSIKVGYQYSTRNNISGFNAPPAGYYPMLDYGFSFYASYLSSTSIDNDYAAYIHIRWDSGYPWFREEKGEGVNKRYGLTIRCVKDVSE